MVDIVIPVYNVEDYIRECIESIINQTYKDIHIILIDNGSVDDSYKICSEYAQKDDRIEVKRINKVPTNEAVKIGVSLCRGKYCIFVDSDDWLAPDLIEHLYINIDKYDGIKCGLTSVWPNRTELIGEECSATYDRFAIDTLIKKFFEDTGTIADTWSNSRCGKLYKTELLQRCINKCDSRLYIGEDLQLNLYYLNECNTVKVMDDYFGYYVRRRDGSITSMFFPELPIYNVDFVEDLYFMADEFGYNNKAIDGIREYLYTSSVLLSLKDIKLENLNYVNIFFNQYIRRRYYGKTKIDMKVLGIIVVYPVIIVGVYLLRKLRKVLKWKES
ncbi:Glycosyl transferase family 2 [Pseudobutyrivibrio ruminis]|uniref:Glycosyl transferase family 2 n=1 Tax=Pseudobutyrivibrio ruminis TaxID=46206 RepID=A0A1H7H621_9FIRM|nr:glycosyltransferase family 2 protein [Pseudobutyrivibrio ruminis]SEK45724.1 Glycosyl transferase family 2 [Pseudobutyrivibrio ruminis]